MNNLETLKNELINQKQILENKNYTVNIANINPSPSEITNTLNNILENDPDTSTFSSYYKIFADPAIYNTVINNLKFPEGITSIRPYFAASLGKNLIGKITIPETVASIGTRAFYDTYITDIEFSSRVTELSTYTFQDCTKLERVYLPDTITALGLYSFQNCTEITELRLSENLTEIANSNFKTLNKLTTLTIPAKVTKILTNNFFIAPMLENLYFKPNTLSIASSSFLGTHNNNLKVWVNFANISTYAGITNLGKVRDHIISEVTISELSFPTTSVSLVWYSNITDATNNTNSITAPTSIGTYYCKLA